MEQKCDGNCVHIEQEDLRNLRNLRMMKQQGGSRKSPLENPENRIMNRCPRCDFISQDKAKFEQHKNKFIKMLQHVHSAVLDLLII